MKLAKIDRRIYRLSDATIQDFILEARSGSAQNLRINALKKFFYVNHPALRNIGNHSFTFCVYQKTKESLFNPMYATRYEVREAAILKAIELCKNIK